MKFKNIGLLFNALALRAAVERRRYRFVKRLRKSLYNPHQGKQEQLRRSVGGWANHKRMTGQTKRQALLHAGLTGE